MTSGGTKRQREGPCACTGVSVLRLDAEAQNQASTWLRAGPSFSPGASVGTGRARGRSWAGPSAGTARARGAANQRPRRAGRRGQRGAGCHRRLARAAGGNLEVPPPPPQEGPGLAAPSGLREPFPATQRRSDAGESVGKSRCAGTREQPYLSSALPLLFFFEEGCAGERRPGSVRGRRGTLPATQVQTVPSVMLFQQASLENAL
ncbi:uncharacterized protein LOC129636031 [Bubalus kerabau]|uniref:uncharacterized protein LOC129636031 n=1 Tax=Bubalus carabanensis TaxID=3119969 RepID=UPI00244E7E0D|nr:uncharacterized protein LOC129636031 [Bubalus carabanensis]